MDEELKQCLEGLPNHPWPRDFPLGENNAYIFIDMFGSLIILPSSGGCIAVRKEGLHHLIGDIAPFCD